MVFLSKESQVRARRIGKEGINSFSLVAPTLKMLPPQNLYRQSAAMHTPDICTYISLNISLAAVRSRYFS